MDLEEGSVCALCRIPIPPAPGEFPLCDSCRRAARARPLPPWVHGVGVLVVVFVMIGLSQFGKAIRAGVENERGQRAEEAHEYAAAARHYAVVVERYPTAVKVEARLAVVQYKAGDVIGCLETMSKLNGKEVDKDTNSELQTIDDELARKLGGSGAEKGRIGGGSSEGSDER